jgi:hypothetical protein
LFEKVEQGNMAWRNPSLSFCHRLPPARPSPEEFLYDSLAAATEMSNLPLHNSDLFVEQDRRNLICGWNWPTAARPLSGVYHTQI